MNPCEQKHSAITTTHRTADVLVTLPPGTPIVVATPGHTQSYNRKTQTYERISGPPPPPTAAVMTTPGHTQKVCLWGKPGNEVKNAVAARSGTRSLARGGGARSVERSVARRDSNVTSCHCEMDSYLI